MKPETAPPPPVGSARQAAAGSLKLVLFYAAFAGLWILLSDLAVEWLFGSPVDRALAQTLKGLLFVAVTSVLVYVLMRRLAGRVRDAARREAAAQTEKLRALQLLEAIADSSSDAIFAKDIDGRFVVFNRASERLTGKQSGEVIGRDETAIFPPELAGRLIADNHRVMTEDRVIMFQEDLATAQGKRTYLTTKGPMRDAGGKLIGMFGAARDITEHKLAERFLAIQNQVLESVAGAAPLPDTLDKLARAVEAEAPGMLVSILLLDADGAHLRHGAAPSLPDAYARAIDGEAIGPSAGSCGTAAWRHEPVVVEDIASDPRWADYRALALAHGLRACWSTPIFGAGQQVLGTFALYYHAPALPNEHHQRLIDLATHVVAIAIARHREEEALRESEARFRAIIESSPVALAVNDERQNITLVSPKFVGTFGYTLADIPNLAAWWSLAYPDPAYRQRVAQEWQAAVHKAQQDGTEMEPMEFAVTCKDGSVRDIRFSMAPMDGSSLVIFHDVTERKKVEQKILAQLDELLRWQRLTVGREERMLQLKAEVNELLSRQGKPARYPGEGDR